MAAMQYLGLEGACVEIGGKGYPSPHVSISVINTTNAEVVQEALDRILARLDLFPDQSIHVILMFAATAEELSEALDAAEIDCNLVTSETNGATRSNTSRRWYHGDIKVLISTTACGMDCPSIGYVMAVVGCWSVQALVQYLGRFREESQGKTARMDVLYVTDISNKLLEKWSASDKLDADRMLAEGLIQNPDHVSSTCTAASCRAWVEESGCRMVNALSEYGGSKTPCGRCDNCTGDCTFTVNSISRYTELQQSGHWDSEAKLILGCLENKCLVCSDYSCNGDQCMNQGYCYHCGCKQLYQNGSFDHGDKCKGKIVCYAMNTGSCYSCLGPFRFTGMQAECHSGHKCKLKKRLRRLYNHCYHKLNPGREKDDGSGFYHFMVPHYSNMLDWSRKLVDAVVECGIKYK